jgi:hypothetical protein
VRRGAALAVVLLAGCGGGGNGRTTTDPAKDTRAKPDTERELREALAVRARRDARRARGLGIRDVHYVIGEGDVDDSRATLRVRLTYGVRGVAGSFASPRTLEMQRSGGRWRVSRQRSRRQRAPWEVGRFRRVSTSHFVVWAPRSVDPVAGGLTDALEAGYERVRGVIAKGHLRRRYLVVVAGDAAQARRITSAIRGLSSLTALTDTEVRQAGPAQRVRSVASQRLLVLWPAFTALPPESQQIVVTHELTHAALAPATSGRTPSWLTEGLALYVSGDRRVGEAAQLVGGAQASAVRRSLTLTALSDPDAIGKLSGKAQSAAYAYASSAAFYINDRFGRGKLLKLYDAFNRESLTGEGADAADQAVRKVLDMPLTRLERDLRRWIVTRVVVDPFAP